MSTTTVAWSDAVKKEARGTNNFDLGEVQDTGTYYVHTQKGIGSKTQFYIPKRMFKSYDGSTVRFDVNESNAREFIRDKYPSDEEYRAKYETQPKEEPIVTPAVTSSAVYDNLERIPIMTERLDVTKHVHRDEVIITKTPYMETKTVDVPVMHEELKVEEVKASSSTKIPQEVRKDLTPETIRIPVEHEDVDVTRTPEVTEELVIHKTPVTETRHISEEVRSERFEVSDKTRATALEEEKKKHSTA